MGQILKMWGLPFIPTSGHTVCHQLGHRCRQHWNLLQQVRDRDNRGGLEVQTGNRPRGMNVYTSDLREAIIMRFLLVSKLRSEAETFPVLSSTLKGNVRKRSVGFFCFE